MTNLKIESLHYSREALAAWKKGDYGMLTSSGASDYIKKIIVAKAKIRPGRRFFGEAFIASRLKMKEGWYNSYKWLTGDKWISGTNLDSKFERPFYDALMKYIGMETLQKLQKEATKILEEDAETYKKPVAPDLWIIDVERKYHFIESKLPGDTISERQLAGLALIDKFVGEQRPVKISLICLYPEGSKKPQVMDYGEKFDSYVKLIESGT